MAIPDYQTFMLPLLRRVAQQPRHIGDLASDIAAEFGLTAQERNAMLPRGGSTVIRSRTGWARTYLKAAGLVSLPRRGFVEITDRGRSVLAEAPDALTTRYLRRFPEFVEFERRSRAGSQEGGDQGRAAAAIDDPKESTPEERIAAAEVELETALRSTLLERLKTGAPAFFERVVIELLRALGYGAGSGGIAELTGGAGDGGIDGIIDEDRLGLDRIYVQAKRFADAAVGAPVIHGFIGSLHMRGASKGVLLTTSTFTKSAIEAAQKNPTMRMVLIDGERLAELMIRHGVGVRTDRTVEIRKIDLDYFEPDDA